MKKKRNAKKRLPPIGALWGIRNFPITIRTQFVGMCTERGCRINHVLETVVARWIREEKAKERQGIK